MITGSRLIKGKYMKIDGIGFNNPVNAINTIDTIKPAMNDSDFAATLQKAFDEGDKKKLKETCVQFETIMLNMLYKQMKATVPEGGFIEKSNAREIFQDMLDETLMERGSRRGTGIAVMMYRQLSRRMENTYKSEPKKASQTNGVEILEEK